MFNAKQKLFTVLTFVLLTALICPVTAESATSAAEKLLAVAPDEMLGFVASSGGDDLKPAFDKTILGRMWNDAGVQSFYQSVKKELLSNMKSGIGDPNEVKVIEAVLDFVNLAVDRPIIVGVAGKSTKEAWPVYGFLILDAGIRKAEITLAVSKREALVNKGDIVETKVAGVGMHTIKDTNDVPIYWGWVGKYFVIGINDGDGELVKLLMSRYRSVIPDHIKNIKKVPGTGDALVVYFDREKIFGVLDSIASKEGGEEEFNLVKLAISKLGLDNIKTVVTRIGFLGPDFVCNEFVEAPVPRTGLLANIKTVELSMLEMVDARAMNAAAWNCDIAGMYDTIIETIKIVSPNDAYPDIEKGISEFETRVNFSIRKGFLQSLSGPMVSYMLPAGAMMEIPRGGNVLIAKLKDAVLFEKSMTALEQFATANSDGMLQVSSQVQNGKTLHTWAMMPLAAMQILPTWTIADGYVVVAGNPALCNLAVAQVESRKNSIRNTEGYKAVTVKLPNNLLCIRYTDSRIQFNQMMMSVQQFWPMVTMGATQAGVKLPFMLPTLSHIANDMGPSVGYSWFDNKGIHGYYRGTGIEQSVGSVAGASLAAGILMPALAKVRQLSQMVVSGTNLRGIGWACMVYANDYNDVYPPNLQVLVEKDCMSAEQLESPLKPKGFDGPSYIYIDGQTVAMDPGNIIAYDNPDFCRGKINVLFNDCHVQAMRPAEFTQELEATYKRLGREMPKTEFKNVLSPRPVEGAGAVPTPVEKE